ncbi:YqjF family protein [Arthrobacter rhombi]|uniref:YqjF family protein n=1 Tax=Arthrobacter rhombi TaxID=71253 RepID=UPI003FD336E7
MSSRSIAHQAPPLGSSPILRQRWSDVTFLHWKVDPSAIAPYMPVGCRPDVIDGSSWVGLIAFQMSKSSFFGSPSIPWLGTFPEVNVRLYSLDERGHRGVVFLSLEASHLIPVIVARAAFGLKYQWASMKLSRRDDKIAYRTRRRGQHGAASHIIVRPQQDPVSNAEIAADPISTFLTARWGFHESHFGHTIYCRNHHEPWPLQGAELVYLDDGLLAAAGFDGLADRLPDSVLYAAEVTTVFASPQRRHRLS